jgi:hypothetical protein
MFCGLGKKRLLDAEGHGERWVVTRLVREEEVVEVKGAGAGSP